MPWNLVIFYLMTHFLIYDTCVEWLHTSKKRERKKEARSLEDQFFERLEKLESNLKTREV